MKISKIMSSLQQHFYLKYLNTFFRYSGKRGISFHTFIYLCPCPLESLYSPLPWVCRPLDGDSPWWLTEKLIDRFTKCKFLWNFLWETGSFLSNMSKICLSFSFYSPFSLSTHSLRRMSASSRHCTVPKKVLWAKKKRGGNVWKNVS